MKKLLNKKYVKLAIIAMVVIIIVSILSEVFDLHGNGAPENDTQAQSAVEEASVKFKQYTYENDENGNVLEYSLFVPENYDASKEYPLVMYIADASAIQKDAKEVTEQFYGACVWATAEEQAKHECFVFVPAFTERVTSDDWTVETQLEDAMNVISLLQEEYSIDADRLYTTGQSMGCMASLYLNSKYPDLFAASLYVSGQWDVNVLEPLGNQKFFYIVAAGDDKASTGQTELKELFDRKQIDYSYASWSAIESLEVQEENIEKMIGENTNRYMVAFETGTVSEGEVARGNEHMDSFNYAYRLCTVRDWLFEQKK